MICSTTGRLHAITMKPSRVDEYSLIALDRTLLEASARTNRAELRQVAVPILGGRRRGSSPHVMMVQHLRDEATSERAASGVTEHLPDVERSQDVVKQVFGRQ